MNRKTNDDVAQSHTLGACLPSQQTRSLFGTYLSEFMARLAGQAELWAGDGDAPCLMVRSDPLQGFELKELTFQQVSDARDFSRGWDLARTGLLAG